MRDRIFEAIFSNGSKIAPSFSDFKKIYERTDFSNVDKKKLSDIFLWGDDSSFFDKDKSLLQALNVDTEDAELMTKIAQEIPTYAAYFSPDAAKKTKSIDLLNAQVELLKIKISQFEKELLSSMTGKEEGQEYEPLVTGLNITAGDSGLTQELVNGLTKVFSRAFSEPGKSPLKPSVDSFVASDEGKKLIKLLQELGVKLPSDRIIDTLLKAPLKKIAEQDLSVAMKSADNTDLAEINSETVRFEAGMDYMAMQNELSELELMSSNDPFVRLGMFYQLCIQQQKEFSDQVMPQSLSRGVNFSEMMQSGNMIEESIKILFGRKADLSAVKELLGSIGAASLQVIRSKWSSVEMGELKTALFVPSMQVIYVAMLNFVVMKALYSFLTKRGEIVATASAEEAKTRALKPADMSKDDLAKTISRLMKNEALQKLLNDNVIYRLGKTGYDQAGIKALKELVYHVFGGPNSQFPNIKNWDIARNPLDGNYDEFFANLIKDIQTTFEIPPLRGGKGDGKVGPITKSFFKEAVPEAVTDLLS